MSPNRETNLALFVDFDNVALGARDARQRFDIKLLIQRILEKGKIIVKKAYADWHYYKEHMTALHETAIELIEVPMPRISGKNSADIRLVVDAMDLCYSKEHIDTFVIVSGDSDFSPLVSKLRENNKRVIGVGMKNSSSHLLISNCDEFIFYDDIYRQNQGQTTTVTANVPGDKRDLFDFLVTTVQSLLQESRGVLYSSLIKDTMTRKQPDFNERGHGYATFGDLLEEARHLGLLVVERDARAGGTWVVNGLGQNTSVDKAGGSRTSRRRRRGSGRNGNRKSTSQAAASAEAKPDPGGASDSSKTSDRDAHPTAGSADAATTKSATPGESAEKKPTSRRSTARKSKAKKATAKKTSTGKSTTKKKSAKKPATGKTPAKKKTTARKSTASKSTPKKPATRKKAPAKKSRAKKTSGKSTSRSTGKKPA